MLFRSDATGGAVIRQIDTEVRAALDAVPRDYSDQTAGAEVIVVLPGSLGSSTEIVRVSRLNIRSRCNLSDLSGESADRYHLTNDVFASALGQLEFLLPEEVRTNWRDQVVVVVYADEGVGSLVLNKGSVIRGAGFAGPMGHMIVERNGQYFDDFRARGALESYCSRPWLSANMVNRYFTDQEKSVVPGAGMVSESGSAFRRALESTPLERKDTLSYRVIAAGIEEEDPLALHAQREAAGYLGWMLSHIVVLLNPHTVILDGAMMHQIPGFFELTVDAMMRYTWVDAWNATQVLQSVDDPMADVMGATVASHPGGTYHDS